MIWISEEHSELSRLSKVVKKEMIEIIVCIYRKKENVILDLVLEIWSHLLTGERKKGTKDLFLECLVCFKYWERQPSFITACNPLIIPTLQIMTFILQRDEVTNSQPRAGLEPRSVGHQMLCAWQNNTLWKLIFGSSIQINWQGKEIGNEGNFWDFNKVNQELKRRSLN